MGAADPAAPRRPRSLVKLWLVLAICAAPVVASYVAFYLVRPSGAPAHGELIRPTRALPADLALRTLAGEPVAAQTLQRQWLLVVVAPAACGEGCERRLFVQRQLREMLGRERDRVDKVWLIPGDGQPSPALRAAVQATPPVTVLRADPAALARWLAPAPGRGLDEHLYVVDPMGEWMMRMPAEVDPALARRDLERLLRASQSWDRAGREARAGSATPGCAAPTAGCVAQAPPPAGPAPAGERTKDAGAPAPRAGPAPAGLAVTPPSAAAAPARIAATRARPAVSAAMPARPGFHWTVVS